MHTLYSLKKPGLWLLLVGLWGFFSETSAQRSSKENNISALDSTHYSSLKWRCVGPFRGGRSAAVTGVPGKPSLFYFGATGGGVWRTTDAGSSWENISDGFFGGSIGAVAVSEYDPNVIYVGGGEKTVRGNVSHGDGMWKSVDAGKTWSFVGLKDSRHITRIRIHPQNPELVYAAVLGHLFGPNQERGVYRSKDGGNTWERVLFANENAGAVDLTFDPTNPRVLYASTWRIRRTPYSLESGGEGSALWKSTDGGDTWTELTKEGKGLPKGTLGIIGVTVSPADPNRVWAIIEADKGGVYRSDDAGKTWQLVNEERKLRQRAWYYTRIYADTKNSDRVYVLNVHFHGSYDGGKTFESISTPHGDHHDLWIAPEDPERLIVGDDGGAQVSLNGGKSWSTYHNQPTAQFYRVTTDNHFPYRIYGGQQDNSTVRILSRSGGGGITERHWESTAGGESAHLAPDPENPEVVFGGSYGGFLTRINHETEEIRSVDVYPDNPMGWGAKDLKYRFQWNFPIMFSPHDPGVLYTAANVLFKTTDEGQSWEAISPDLTRNDTTKMGASGGPITKDNTSVEYYGTIFAVAEDPSEKGVIWSGSDDGLVYLSRDGGDNWENVTPAGMPEWMMINSVEPHPTQNGVCYVAGTRYKLDDFKPYLYKTKDYGKTWTKITQGIADDHFTRVLRADPEREGLLYAGTERGVYLSFNEGSTWQPLGLNLPIVPVTDLAVKRGDLIAATQGRSFWVLDDLTVLRQTNPQLANKAMHLYKPAATYNNLGYDRNDPQFEGENPPAGVSVHFYLKEAPDTSRVVELSFLDQQNNLIRQFTTKKDKDLDPHQTLVSEFKAKKGSNRFVWDMRYPDAVTFDNLILWAGGTRGPEVAPGTYTVRLKQGEDVQEEEFEILKDPRISLNETDLRAQRDFLLDIQEKVNETHRAIIRIREVKEQVQDFTKRIAREEGDSFKAIKDSAKSLVGKLEKIEQALYQTKNQSRQDPLNYPIRLNNKLSALGSLASVGYNPPTQQAKQVKEDLTREIDRELQKLREVERQEIPAFNQMANSLRLPVVSVKEGEQ